MAPGRARAGGHWDFITMNARKRGRNQVLVCRGCCAGNRYWSTDLKLRFWLDVFFGRASKVYEVAGGSTKSSCEPAYVDERDITFAVLDPADIRAVKASLKSQVLLRPVLLRSQLSESATKKDLGIFAHTYVPF